MSETNLISPLLDGFSMGSPISDHDGVCCCPAIRENTDEQYIVKIITIPASQTQLDALLLTGAYSDPADAMEYFRRQGEEILEEAENLKKLSRLDGFFSYDRWQMEPITRRRLGYQVYLIGPFRQSLEKYVRGSPVTHLQAMNLGLDLCSALAFCRQAGAIYVDLKPSNIFLTPQGQYRIGDLGFVPLDALSYTVIPDKYRSVYTPPELHDPMASMNMTADTYALGMILYQLYNDGQLPFREKAPQEALPSPLNADYELAEIILRAVDPDPFQRWNDPRDFGQALRAYMQRNTVNDDPITVHTPLEVELEEDRAADTVPESSQEPQSPEQPEEAVDETAPGEADAQDLLPHELSDEVSKIVAKADDLISHETPGGVVLPEVPEPEDPFAFAAVEDEALEDASTPREPLMEEPEEPKPEDGKNKKERRFLSPDIRRRKKKARAAVITTAAAAAAIAGGLLYYRNIYQLPIRELRVSSTKDSITVQVDSEAADSLLTLTCTDSGGRSVTQDVLNGTALFTGLNPDSTYHIQLQAQGFHALVGPSEKTIDTAATTNLLSFTALAGPEDGSVILSFEMEGEEPDEWTLTATAEGEEARVQSFTGHSVTVMDLTVGKTYTFAISAADLQSNSSISVSGQTSLTYLANRLILAKNITADLTGEGGLAVAWKAPGDVVVESWTVRCYNENGYDQSVTTESCDAFFESIDPAAAYTVEITAQGMSQPALLEITENAIQVGGFTVAGTADDTALTLQWDASGASPEGGWLLTCAIDGSALSSVIRCGDASASVEPKIPGAAYRFQLSAADGTTVYGGSYSYECPQAQPFDENRLSSENVQGHLLKTPGDAAWRYETVGSDAFTDSFSPSDGISLVLHAGVDFYRPGTEVDILYVIRDSLGNVQPELTGGETVAWNSLWEGGDVHYGELDLPHTPVLPGDYTLDVYVNGKTLVSLPFHID